MRHSFSTAGRIVFGAGRIRELRPLLTEMACRRPLVILDPGLKASGLLDETLRSLQGGNLGPIEFARVEPDPPESVIQAAVALATEQAADGVIGIGGGSSLDTAKLVALLARSPQPLADIYGVERAKGSRLPLVLAPTTAGTGSEVTPIAVVTTPGHEKQGVVAPQLLADVALLDPELTLTLPAAVTAATGVDAMVHAIEAFTSKLLKNPISDALALQALRLLHRNLPRVLQDGRDREAREAMLEGSLLAGMAFANAPVAAVHALAYPLGARFHLAHGVTNALMLAHVVAFNLETCPDWYAQLAAAIVPGGEALDRTAAARAFLREMQGLNAAAGLPRRLRDVGIPESVLPTLATEAARIERLLRNNPRPVTADDALCLYRQAW